MNIYDLVVDPGREEHIAQHHVGMEEVEEVVEGDPFVTPSHQGRCRLIGQTAGDGISLLSSRRGDKEFMAWSLPVMRIILNGETTCVIEEYKRL